MMTPLEKVSSLSDAEQGYLARWIAALHPDVAEEALAALTRYRHDHADTARLMLGPARPGDDPELYDPPSGHHCKACEVET